MLSECAGDCARIQSNRQKSVGAALGGCASIQSSNTELCRGTASRAQFVRLINDLCQPRTRHAVTLPKFGYKQPFLHNLIGAHLQERIPM